MNELRKAIAALKQNQSLQTPAAQGYYSAIDDVLTIIDRSQAQNNARTCAKHRCPYVECRCPNATTPT